MLTTPLPTPLVEKNATKLLNSTKISRFSTESRNGSVSESPDLGTSNTTTRFYNITGSVELNSSISKGNSTQRNQTVGSLDVVTTNLTTSVKNATKPLPPSRRPDPVQIQRLLRKGKKAPWRMKARWKNRSANETRNASGRDVADLGFRKQVKPVPERVLGGVVDTSEGHDTLHLAERDFNNEFPNDLIQIDFDNPPMVYGGLMNTGEIKAQVNIKGNLKGDNSKLSPGLVGGLVNTHVIDGAVKVDLKMGVTTTTATTPTTPTTTPTTKPTTNPSETEGSTDDSDRMRGPNWPLIIAIASAIVIILLILCIVWFWVGSSPDGRGRGRPTMRKINVYVDDKA